VKYGILHGGGSRVLEWGGSPGGNFLPLPLPLPVPLPPLSPFPFPLSPSHRKWRSGSVNNLGFYIAVGEF